MGRAKSTRVCGNQMLYADSNTRYITSPDWPRKYPDSCDCYYEITAMGSSTSSAQHAVLQLQWLEFDIHGYLGSCEDFVAVEIK